MDYKNAGWHFGGENAEGFDNHVRKSIPWYEEGHDLILSYADFFTKKNGRAYDLGCSTGVLTKALAKKVSERHVTVIGIDESIDMISLAKESSNSKLLDFIHADIVSEPLLPSNLIVAYYTLHFLHEAQRTLMLKKIHESLESNGAFFLFDKTLSAVPLIETMTATLLTEFKFAQGFSPDEILKKTISLKGILNPLPSSEMIESLRNAGFKQIDRIFKLNSFEGFLAIKT